MRRNVGGLQELRGPGCQPSQQGNKDLSPAAAGNWILMTTSVSLEVLSSSDPPDRNRTLPVSCILISALLYWTAYLQKCELIHECCFKPLSLW